MPPIRKMLEMKIPVGLGTDGTRVSSYVPWPSIYWAVTGKTAGGMPMWQAKDRLTRYEALKLMTQGSAWFSGEEKLKGQITKGQYADLVILPKDYFSIPEAEIKTLESALTVVNGRIVHAGADFGQYAPEQAPVQPEWSPVKYYGGYQNH
jgi:predicted amidohydrolase YtcJ